MWKEVAWDGIRFMAPSHWEAGKIGPRYLMLEEETGPVLEVKMGLIKGRYAPQTQMRRLAAAQGRGLRKSLKDYDLPEPWDRALQKFVAQGFSWQGETVGGMGVIIYCPTCRRATLLQFFQKGTYPTKKITRRVLETFQDHRSDKQVVWALFDIRAVIPETYKLTRHRFTPGEFELIFATKGQRITLKRWGPASILLKGGNLIQFAEKTLRSFEGVLQPVVVGGNRGVEWRIKPPRRTWEHIRSGLRLRAVMQRFRLWHLEGKNRILGSGFEGKRSIDPQFVDRICGGYESL